PDLTPPGLVHGHPDRAGHPDAASTSDGHYGDNAAVLLNRTLAHCSEGNVNASKGPVTDVLFVNDSSGGVQRRVKLATYEPITVYMGAPPTATEEAPFAMYAWPGEPSGATLARLPFRIGFSCMPTPLTGGSPAPLAIWNNAGRSRRLRAAKPPA